MASPAGSRKIRFAAHKVFCGSIGLRGTAAYAIRRSCGVERTVSSAPSPGSASCPATALIQQGWLSEDTHQNLPTNVHTLNAPIFIVNTNSETRPNRTLMKRRIMKAGRRVERIVRKINSLYVKGLSRGA